jgi:proteasome lid subunit RPN8/RPN11
MSSLDIRAIDETGLRAVPCPATRQEYRVFLAEEAFDRAVERGAGDTTREVGGVLVGELLRDDAGPYLRIETTIDALHAEEKGAELTFTHATWEHIHKEMDARPGKRVVGWYHTHPGFGVFLSDRDQFIHKSFFNLPFQVALVYDPKTREHGLFTWRDDEVVRSRRYWIGTREQIWDGARALPRPDKKPGSDRTTTGASASREPATGEGDGASPLAPPSVMVIAAVLLLVLVAGFVGHWLGTGAARQALAEVQIEMARAKNEGAQAAIGTLQRDLVGLLRETLGDQAVRKPTTLAIGELDRAVTALTAASQPTAAGDRVREALSLVVRARDSLARLREDRASAEAVLAQLERQARRTSAAPPDLSRDVADQRAALGGLYAELATDAVVARDTARARRLLAAAAHIDPGNRARYEKQLQGFDRAGKLPPQIRARAAEGRR